MTREHRRAELADFICLLVAHGVRRYLEIGARRGDTFDAIMRSLPVGAHGLAVDLPAGPWGAVDSRGLLGGTVAQLNHDGYHCDVVFGSSQSPRVIEQVGRLGPFDAVLIDADHRYDAVAADWNNYRAHARIVAFHDIAGVGIVDRGSGFAVEVPRLWGEVKALHRHHEIVAPGSIFGIGVVYP